MCIPIGIKELSDRGVEFYPLFTPVIRLSFSLASKIPPQVREGGARGVGGGGVNKIPLIEKFA